MKQHIHQLTVTRFVGAMAVVAFHYGKAAFPMQEHIAYIFLIQSAVPAVSYFFTLSGFIMAYVYYQPDQHKFNYVKYYIARFARIYPMYLLGLLWVVSYSWGAGGGKKALALNLTMTHSWLPEYPLTFNIPGWSVSAEVFFYLLFPFILMWMSKRSIKTGLWVGAILWLATQVTLSYLMRTYYASNPPFWHDVLFYNPLPHFAGFIFGAAAGNWYRDRYADPGREVNQKWNLAIFWLGIAIWYVFIDWANTTMNTQGSVPITSGVLTPLFLLIIVSLSLDRTRLSKILGHPIAVALGDTSYGIYILQKPVWDVYLRFLKHYDIAWRTDRTLRFYIYLTLLIGIAFVLFRIFETPLRVAIRKWGSKMLNKPASAKVS